ncbi:unnamed protein product [Parnassius apollo]|uniref:(apollo) hypothetical protein n=1 Tax=Parnassius apollo TaxID=110799 RepID=A0A8S3YAP7_PARAO|nr:unnamed protein product [Parnassius apollo]
MAKYADMKEVVKHLVNGTFSENLCRICLLPFNTSSEDIFTTVCKNDKEYSIADVLDEVCNIKISPCDQYKICSECFATASSSYKFYLLTKRSDEILNFYINLLEEHLSFINTSDDIPSDSLCITLPLLNPETQIFDYDLTGVLTENDAAECMQTANDAKTITSSPPIEELVDINISEDNDDNDIVIIADEKGEPTFYKALDGTLIPLDENSTSKLSEVLKSSLPNNKIKRKRRRNPMSYIMCSKCPVRYRFVAKLKEHMKAEHDIDLFICVVCKAIIEGENEFNKHLKTHSNIHMCAKCNVVFKKRDSIIAHLKWHEEMENLKQAEGAHVCEVCGQVLRDEEHLKEHNDKKHVKKYTCYYCGRMYKGEISFETHIKKHEMHTKRDTKQETEKIKVNKEAEKREEIGQKNKKFSCGTCERNFVNERSLMWHQRLHTNERPYVCDVCGRAFVSLNRRNQHAVCAPLPAVP